MLCTIVVHNDMHTREQFLKMSVGLGLRFVDLFLDLSCCVFFFWFSFDCFTPVFAYVVLGLVSSVLRQEIGWEERLRNDLFCASGP